MSLCTVPCICHQRLVLAVMAFLGFINLYAMRVNLSVAIVCMVNHTVQDLDNSVNMTGVETNQECSRDGNTTAVRENGELNWSKPIQGLVLSSFFWGYVVTQIPGSWLSTRYGGKRVIGCTIAGCALLNLIMPIAAKTHPVFLMVLRVLAGLCQGCVWGSILALWAYWAPPLERSRLIALTYAGVDVGNALTIPAAGLLCKYGFAGGWPSIFYVGGIFGLIWSFVWMFTVYDTPEQHPRISEKEKIYIQTSLVGHTPKLITTRHVPWLAILKSPPVWAMVVANFTMDWTMYIFLTNLPTYMKEVLQFDIQQSVLLSCLPYIGIFTISMLSGVIADKLRSSRILTTTVVRKLFNTFGSFLSAIVCICLGFISCSQHKLGVAMLVSALSLIGTVVGGGYVVNHTDVAPKYAPLLFGISNCTASSAGFLAPTVIGFLTRDKTQAQWRQVFFLSAGINIFGSIFYLLTASGEIQDWAIDTTVQTDEVKKLKGNEKADDTTEYNEVSRLDKASRV